MQEDSEAHVWSLRPAPPGSALQVKLLPQTVLYLRDSDTHDKRIDAGDAAVDAGDPTSQQQWLQSIGLLSQRCGAWSKRVWGLVLPGI